MTAADALDVAGQVPPPVRRAGKSLSMTQALDLIPDNSRVYLPPLMGPPTAFLEAMAAAADRWADIETTCDYLAEPIATFAAPNRPFRHLSVQASRALQPMADAGALQVVSGCSSQFAGLYKPGGPLAVDVVLVQVSLPGPDGRFSLGTNGGATPELVRSAPLVLAEINPTMPYTRGAVECDRTDFDGLVEVPPHPLVEIPVPEPTTVTDRIGGNVADLIADGAVLEYGIGAIPDAALAALAGHRRLGLHSGMLGDAVIDLVESGAMTGEAKSVDAGLHVTSCVVGTSRVARWVDGRDDVVVVASGYSHGVPALARQHRFTAVNSAIEVAFDGSINAELVGGRVLSGPGGQPDFATGASLAPDGLSIVALPATARGGTQSRIVPSIGADGQITVPHYLVDRVVTEFGVAELKGADRAQREERLRAIMSPSLLD
ncbi:MAG: acetyl-CoA hydrolase/transferase C-terminal domain-containing protein [Actinomycetota bacterium]